MTYCTCLVHHPSWHSVAYWFFMHIEKALYRIEIIMIRWLYEHLLKVRKTVSVLRRLLGFEPSAW